MLGGGADAHADCAFERLYRRHVADVYRYACAVLANPTDAEDVAQTVFLNAYRAFQSGTRPEEPLNWLIAITHNVCRQRVRAGSRRPREVVLDPDLASEHVEDEERFRREDIVRALSQLSLNQRAALAMRELEGRSYAEIASLLGMTKAAVEALIFRARRSFREQLEGSLTCSEAERAIALQLDGVLPRADRRSLRAHLRACSECASLARRLRAQGSARRALALVPLPPSLAGGFGLSGGAAVGTAIGVKAVALGAATLVAAGVGTEVVMHSRAMPNPSPAAATPAPRFAAADRASPNALSRASRHAALPRAAATTRRVHSAPTTTHAARRLRADATTHAAAASTPEPHATAQTSRTGSTPEAAGRAGTLTRQRPHLSGGGRRPAGTAYASTVRDAQRPARRLRPPVEHGPSAPAHQHPVKPKPDHPAKSDDPANAAHTANPGDPGQSDRIPGKPPAQPPTSTPDLSTRTDVAAPVPDPPPAPSPPSNGGGPPAETPAGKPPKPPVRTQ
jgi:RNA polymerase sigma factor (sigma-70 family)